MFQYQFLQAQQSNAHRITTDYSLYCSHSNYICKYHRYTLHKENSTLKVPACNLGKKHLTEFQKGQSFKLIVWEEVGGLLPNTYRCPSLPFTRNWMDDKGGE